MLKCMLFVLWLSSIYPVTTAGVGLPNKNVTTTMQGPQSAQTAYPEENHTKELHQKIKEN